jgi:MYXO-CTERM domain-containing protein
MIGCADDIAAFVLVGLFLSLGRRRSRPVFCLFYTEKELPQPHDSSALGLEN